MQFIKQLPLYTEQHGNYMEIVLWDNESNVCEMAYKGDCIKNNTEFFGAKNEVQPMFCFKHFMFDVVKNGKYKIVTQRQMENKLAVAKANKSV